MPSDRKVDVVTDRITTSTVTGIALEGGQHLGVDVIVTATGQNLRMAGGISPGTERRAALAVTSPGMEGSPRRRLSGNDLRHELDVLVSMARVGRFSEQQLCSTSTEQVARLTHRGEGDCCRCSELDVVVAHDGEVPGDVHAERDALLEQTEGDLVVRAESRRRPSRARETGDAGTGQTSGRDGQGLGGDVDERILWGPGLPQRHEGAGATVAHLPDRVGTPDEGDALVAVVQQVFGGQLPSEHVIHGDAAQLQVISVPIHQHHGCAAPGDVQKRRILRVDGCH